MPIYQYTCVKDSTHPTTDRVKSIKVSDRERENDKCETCNAKAVLKISHPSPPILVGRGFHSNDYGAPTKG